MLILAFQIFRSARQVRPLLLYSDTSGVNPELDFGGGGGSSDLFNFHVRSFLVQLFAIGIIVVSGS